MWRHHLSHTSEPNLGEFTNLVESRLSETTLLWVRPEVACQFAGGGRFVLIGEKWEVGLQNRWEECVEVGGVNTRYINNITNYINNITTQPLTVDWCPVHHMAPPLYASHFILRGASILEGFVR